jgi:Glycosyl hydrolases family 16
LTVSARIRRIAAAAVALPLALTLALTLAPSSATVDHARDEEPGPIHAGNTFGWYPTVWREEFHGDLAKYWDVEGPGVVQHQNGMLTLNTTDTGSVSATLDRKGDATGRWEVRLRSRSYGAGDENYRVLTELVPSDPKADHCGALDIALNDYQIGRSNAQFRIRNLPDQQFTARQTGMDLGKDRWHTYAVEVTPKRISWFVDAAVVNSERRKDALSGVPLTVRFTMQAAPDAAMNPSRMQMDWLRHWSLDKPNEKSVAAPRTTRGTYKAAC